jgi:hypothetical protein
MTPPSTDPDPDGARGRAALARVTAFAAELATLGDLAEIADDLELIAVELDDLCAERRIEPP